MSFDYAKDHRTTKKVKQDYISGKTNEKKVLEAVGKPFFLVEGGDQFMKTEGWVYCPDAFIQTDIERWAPVEIKTSKYIIPHYEFKKNQVDKLAGWGGFVLFAYEDRFFSMSAEEVSKFSVFDDSYCSKPCYRVSSETVEWQNFRVRISFV